MLLLRVRDALGRYVCEGGDFEDGVLGGGT